MSGYSTFFVAVEESQLLQIERLICASTRPKHVMGAQIGFLLLQKTRSWSISFNIAVKLFQKNQNHFVYATGVSLNA